AHRHRPVHHGGHRHRQHHRPRSFLRRGSDFPEGDRSEFLEPPRFDGRIYPADNAQTDIDPHEDEPGPFQTTAQSSARGQRRTERARLLSSGSTYTLVPSGRAARCNATLCSPCCTSSFTR
ncbi:MAG: hypothetical protein ACFLMY_06045, partial [Candidatus Brachytrichaceae bacterium NZ_4S206]